MSKNSFFYEEDLSTLSSEFYGRIYKDIIKRDGFSSNIIENYNNEMFFKIPELIMNTKFEARDGIISFENVRPTKPTDTVKGKTEPLFPREARMKTIPYFGDILADVVFTPRPIGYLPNGQPIYSEEAKPERKENFELGAIPVMLGSQLCHLHNLSEEELLSKGECIGDPFGYFIIKSERIIITQSKLRVSAFLIYDDARLKCTVGMITCPTEQGRMVLGIQIHPKYKFLRVVMQYMLKNNNKDGSSIFLIFKVLGVDVDKAIKMIKKYIPEENHEKADYALQPSIAEFNSINAVTQEDYIEYIKQQRHHWERNDIVKVEQIIPDIIKQLFCDVKKVEDKLEHLAMYSARMVEIIMGTREIDDRDSWGSCQLETPGKLLTQLFKEIWAPIRRYLDLEVRKGEGIRAFTNTFKANQIKDNFISAFGPNAWGSKSRLRSGTEGENITESLKRDTPVAIYSQITKVTNTKASRQSSKEDVRMVHPSQLGYIDLYETPDGEGNGLVKNLTASCYISLERDPVLYQAMFRPEGPLGKYIYADKMDETMVPFLLNGKIQGWCIPKDLIKKLKAMRKNGSEIQKDVCIFYNDNNRCVEMFCDGGRPTRPLFVVDEDQQLVVKKKRLENADIPTLIREGCIEYIDAREQEYITIAERIEKIEDRNKRIISLDELLDQEEKLNTYIPAMKELIDYLVTKYPEEKKLENPKKRIDEIDDKTDNDKEKIVQFLASKLRTIINDNPDYEEEKQYLTDEAYDLILKNSKELEIEEISRLPNYDYCEIDPVAMFSPSVAIIPMAHRQAGPRTGFQSGMNKQALTQYHSNEATRFDASYKMLYYPTRALFQTDMQDSLGLNRLANGQTITVAIVAHPDNPEDGIVFKEEAIKYGCKFDMAKKQTTISIATSNNDYSEHFQKPEIKPGTREGIYDALDDNGIPRLDAYIRQGDCIIGKIRKYNNNKDNPKAGTTEEIGEYAGVGEEGFVDRVLVVQNVKRDTVVKVKIRKNRKYIPGDKLACLTDDHQILTRNRGWISVKDTRLEDNIATINEVGELEYQNPTALHAYTYEGNMYHIKSQQVDQFVTPTHRMYIKKRDKSYYELDTAQNIFGKRVNYKKNVSNMYPDAPFFNLPAAVYTFNGVQVYAPEKHLNMDAFLILLGIWIGDGWVTNGHFTIAANKPRVQQALDEIAPVLGFTISKCSDDKWYIHDRQLSSYFSNFSLGASGKYLPDWCLNLSQRQSRILIEGLMLSDGHKTNKGSYQYYTSSIHLVDGIQHLSLRAGWSANVNVRIEAGAETTMTDGRIIKANYDNWIIKIIREKNEPQVNHGHSKTQNGQTEEWVPYSGNVYCITVPNQVFYIRRNGIPSWTGNSRYSQKGTVSKVVPSRYLPRIADGPNAGLVPDIIINPYGLLSRMTMNKIIEIRSSKAAVIGGRFFNATTYRNYKPEDEYIEKILDEHGLDTNCDENFIFPDGTRIQQKVFFGPCHYQALRHHVSDKIQMRAKQGVKPNTRQPVSGRSKEGGLKVGEMERDALISHGSSALLRERLMDVSDGYTLPICSTCGTIAITDHRNKIYKCNLCREKAKIGTIRIPYVAKLLLFFLNACGIHMTFTTENAIDELGRPEERFLV